MTGAAPVAPVDVFGHLLRSTGMSRWSRFAPGLIMAIALAMTLYHLYTAWFGAPDALSFRAIHVAFALVLAFLITPARGGETDNPGVFQYVLAILSVIAAGYILWAQSYIDNRMIYVDDLVPEDWVLGSLMILLLLEATRRSVGLALPLTAAAFLAYAVFVAGSDLAQLMEQMYLGTEGIFGIPVSVTPHFLILRNQNK